MLVAVARRRVRIGPWLKVMYWISGAGVLVTVVKWMVRG